MSAAPSWIASYVTRQNLADINADYMRREVAKRPGPGPSCSAELHQAVDEGIAKLPYALITPSEQSSRNVIFTSAVSDRLDTELGKLERWARVSNASELAAALREVDAEAAAKFEICQDPDNGFINYCPSGHYAKFHPCRCWLRICPNCAKAIAQRLRRRYEGRIAKVMAAGPGSWSLKHLVLTVKRGDDLRADIARVHKATRKLIKHFWTRHDKRAGAFGSIEIGPAGGNVHVHVIVYGPWVAQADVSAYWEELTDNPVVWISRIEPSRAVGEAVKYATKLAKRDTAGKFVTDVADLVILHQALKGKRRVWAWGAFYGVDDETEPPAPVVCPSCKAVLLSISVPALRASLLYLKLVIKSPGLVGAGAQIALGAGPPT